MYGSRGNLKPTKLILSYERAEYKKIKKLCASELNSLEKSKSSHGLSNLAG